jgi:hypothetical protein
MNYQHILLCVLTLPVSFTIYGQESNERRIQELKDAWYKEAEESSRLSIKIQEKYERLVSEWRSTFQDLSNIFPQYSEEKKDSLLRTYTAAINTFLKKLFIATHETCNLESFLFAELFKNPYEYLPANVPIEKNNIHFDHIKFLLLSICTEIALFKKLIEDYEKNLQKMTIIDHELVLLGHPTLYSEPDINN